MSIDQQIADICSAGKNELDGFHERLNEARLRPSTPEITFANSRTESLTAEFRVEFFFEGQMVDILEFFIFRDGKAVSSEEEIRAWIQEDVADVLEKQKQRQQSNKLM